MANTLTDLMPKILARGLDKLRGRLVMPMAINRDYSLDPATRGQTVNVPKPPSLTARAVSPGVTPTAAPDITENTVDITLDQWFEVPIAFTDKDRIETVDDSVEMAVDAAVDALAEKVNATIFGLYKEVYSNVGTAGTTPFASNYDVASEARKLLNNLKSPLNPRRMVIDPDAEENAINLSAFADSSFTDNDSVIIEGDIGRKLGFDWIMDQQVPSHTAGSITTGLTAKSSTAQAVGDQTILATTAASTGAADLKEGDLINFAGDSQDYVVTADVAEESASTDLTINIAPGLKVALEGDEDITLVTSTDHANNLAFHRDAFAIAIRPFRAPASDAQVLTMVDDVSGLPLRLEVSRQNKQDYWSFDLLWGVKTIRPELAVRVFG